MAKIIYCLACKKAIKKSDNLAMLDFRSKDGKAKFHVNCLITRVSELVLKPAIKIVNKEHLKNYAKIRDMLDRPEEDLEGLKI